MTRLIPLLVLAAGIAYAEPNDSEHVAVHAVMFLIEFDVQANIRHAQVVGGYPSEDRCKDAMPRVLAAISPQLDKDLTPQLKCWGVRKEVLPPKDLQT